MAVIISLFLWGKYWGTPFYVSVDQGAPQKHRNGPSGLAHSCGQLRLSPKATDCPKGLLSARLPPPVLLLLPGKGEESGGLEPQGHSTLLGAGMGAGALEWTPTLTLKSQYLASPAGAQHSGSLGCVLELKAEAGHGEWQGRGRQAKIPGCQRE